MCWRRGGGRAPLPGPNRRLVAGGRTVQQAERAAVEPVRHVNDFDCVFEADSTFPDTVQNVNIQFDQHKLKKRPVAFGEEFSV